MPDDIVPAFTPEQLVTPPSCPPLVGGFGRETPEAKNAREAAEKSDKKAPESPTAHTETKTTTRR